MKKDYMYGFLTVFLTALFVISCGGGGDESESNLLTLSSTSAYPGEFVTFTHDSFKEDKTVNVTWSDGQGYEVKSEGFSSKDKTLMVPVPAYFNLEKGTLKEGKVNISLSGISKVMQLNIQKPEEIIYVGEDRPGSVIIDSFKDDIFNYQATLTNIQEFVVETTETETKISDEIGRLQATVTEFETMGTFSQHSDDGTTQTMTDQELRDIESLLYTVIRGMMLALDATSTTARFAQTSYHRVEDSPGSDFVKGWSKDLKKATVQAKNGSKVLLAGVGVIAGVAALLLLPAEVAVGTALLIGTLTTAGYVLITGTASEGMASMSHQIDKQTSTPSTYEKGTELLEAVKEGAKNLALSAGSLATKTLGGLAELGNNVWTLFTTEVDSKCKDVKPSERITNQILYRETPPTLADTEEFCEEIGISPLVCSPDQKVIDGVCVNKTCKVDNYKCPTCTGDQELAYNSDGSGICELNCSDSQKEVGDRCVDKTCQADTYNCPTCAAAEVLKYNADGSGYCEMKPCVPPACCGENPQVCIDKCIPSGADCCDNGGFCVGGVCAGDVCCPSETPVFCVTGCYEEGIVCCPGVGACFAGSVCLDDRCCPAVAPLKCGSGCMPGGFTCCDAAGSSCPPGTMCTSTGCTGGKARTELQQTLSKSENLKAKVQSNPLLNLQRSKNPAPFWKQ